MVESQPSKLLVAGSSPVSRSFAHIAQLVEHVIGNDEVMGSNPIVSSILIITELILRDIITLECTSCKRRNYTTTKNKKKQSGRVEYKKYCPWCNKRTSHKETK